VKGDFDMSDDTKFTSFDYFQKLKSSKEEMTEAKLENFYNNCLSILEKFQTTGQIDAMKKVIFLAETVTREKQILSAGITQYVYKNAIDEYIESIADDDVSIIELEKYERVIPDDIIEKVAICKDLFDEMYVLFTDYTYDHQKKIETERINKDPILFGALKNGNIFHDRFYVIGDWEDEYCHLTMEKFLSDFKAKGKNANLKDIYTPEKLEDLKNLINKTKIKGNSIHLNEEVGNFELTVSHHES